MSTGTQATNRKSRSTAKTTYWKERSWSTSQQSESTVHSFCTVDTISALSNVEAHPSPVYNNHYVTLHYNTYKFFARCAHIFRIILPINIHYFPLHSIQLRLIQCLFVFSLKFTYNQDKTKSLHFPLCSSTFPNLSMSSHFKLLPS